MKKNLLNFISKILTGKISPVGAEGPEQIAKKISATLFKEIRRFQLNWEKERK